MATISTSQKNYIDMLLKQHELDRKTVTLAHVELCRKAKVSPAPDPGERVDDWLGELSSTQASRIIGTLKDGADELENVCGD